MENSITEYSENGVHRSVQRLRGGRQAEIYFKSENDYQKFLSLYRELMSSARRLFPDKFKLEENKID